MNEAPTASTFETDTTVKDTGVLPRTESRKPVTESRLLLIGPTRQESIAIADGDSILIGRAADSGVRIDDPSISRRHARLTIGPRMTIEDLGSANGTLIRDRRLCSESSDVHYGDVIELGDWMLIVLHQAQRARRAALLSRTAFDAVLEAECARAECSDTGFVLVRVRVPSGTAPETVSELLSGALGPISSLGTSGPAEYQVLAASATRVEEQVLAAFKRAGLEISCGVARFPDDGRTTASLTSAAEARARGLEAPVAAPQDLVIHDPAMVRIHRLIDRIAPGRISVLILGETGAGKERIAETIHRRSSRADKPFVRLHCAALSESLIESELFGHERGAFTGAVQSKPGLLESADGGTIFLDEVGEIPPATQVKLLRVLEDRLVQRVGGLKPRAIDVRFIAATNRDLSVEVAEGRFRRDLYFRLGGIALTVPPLRERPSEIAVLARMFAAHFLSQDGREAMPRFAPGALEVLTSYCWPGNIRELRNVIERAVLLAGGEEITADHLFIDPALDAPAARAVSSPVLELAIERRSGSDPGGRGENVRQLADAMDDFEREEIGRALALCGGNQTKAAAILGISRRTIVKRLRELGIPRPRRVAGE